jgi:hypothetical protein
VVKVNEKMEKILKELEAHKFATCDCQSAAEHVRWVEKKLKELREAIGKPND